MLQLGKQEYGYISIDDFERVITPMWGTKDEMYAVIMSLMRYRGLAPIEACQLKLEHVQDDTILYHRPKTGHTSTMKLPALASARLKDWIAKNKHRMFNGYVFTCPNSVHYHVQTDTVRHKFRDYVRRARLSCDFVIDPNKKLTNAGRRVFLLRLYDLRGSFATDVYRQTKDLFKTAVSLRHKDTRTAHKYLRRAILYDEEELVSNLFRNE